MLQNLKPKWNPLDKPPQDNLMLTRERLDQNRTARESDEFITFNPTARKEDSLESNFWIFTKPGSSCQMPAYRKRRQNTLLEEEITVYTDRSCLENGEKIARMGSGIWFRENDAWNTALRIPRSNQSNQVRELAAVLYTTKAILPFAPLKIISDARYVIDGLTSNL